MRLDSNYLQAIGTLAAAIAALIALFVAWDQGRVMRQEIRASVWPALQIDGSVTSDSDQLSVGLSIQNAGVGPARIDAFTMRYEGRLIENIEALSELFPEYQSRSATLTSGRLLAAGDTVEVFSFRFPPAQGIDAVPLMMDLASRYEIEICFCSVLEECWVTDSSIHNASSKPETVKACPVEGISNL